MVINLIGYLPAGFAIAVLLNQRVGNRFSLFLITALLASGLSLTIERRLNCPPAILARSIWLSIAQQVSFPPLAPRLP